MDPIVLTGIISLVATVLVALIGAVGHAIVPKPKPPVDQPVTDSRDNLAQEFRRAVQENRDLLREIKWTLAAHDSKFENLEMALRNQGEGLTEVARSLQQLVDGKPLLGPGRRR